MNVPLKFQKTLRICFLLLALIISAIILLQPTDSFGQTDQTSSLGNTIGDDNTATTNEKYPQKFEVGIYVVNIPNINLQGGSYDMDFYIWARSNDTNFVENPPNFDFMNGRVDRIEPQRQYPDYYESRVSGTFLKNMDFRSYPFERLLLTVEVEGITGTDELVFVPDIDESGFDPDVNFPGWRLVSHSSNVVVHHYPDGDWSRYIFSFTIERYSLSSFLKTVFPVIIITSIAMFAFWMKAEDFTSRIALAATTLLAAVAAHLTVANQLPEIGYLTLMDKIMIVSYSLFVNVLLSLVLQMRLVDNKKEEEAIILNANMRRLIPMIITAVFISLLFI